jgi:hypothetical protein
MTVEIGYLSPEERELLEALREPISCRLDSSMGGLWKATVSLSANRQRFYAYARTTGPWVDSKDVVHPGRWQGPNGWEVVAIDGVGRSKEQRPAIAIRFLGGLQIKVEREP